MLKITDILIPTDFSENNANALQYGFVVAQTFAATLHLIHVIEPSDELEALANLPESVALDLHVPSPVIRAEMRLESLTRQDLPGEYNITRFTSIGTPSVEILNYAQNHNIDLMVVGTHGYTGLEHVLLGSVAEQVVQKSVCPVLTIQRSADLSLRTSGIRTSSTEWAGPNNNTTIP